MGFGKTLVDKVLVFSCTTQYASIRSHYALTKRTHAGVTWGVCVYVYTEIHRRGMWTVNHFDYRVVISIKGIVSNNCVDIP